MGDAHLSNLGANTERLLGFFNDPASNTPTQLGCIGAIYETPGDPRRPPRSSARLPKLTPLEEYSFFGVHAHVTYFNSAHFRDVKSLDVQKNGKRFTGLKITRCSGLVDVLGQWDPTSHTSTSTLYSSEQGPLGTLTFVLSPYPESVNPRDAFLEDILTDSLPCSDKQTLLWNDTQKVRLSSPRSRMSADEAQRIGWWFTPQYDHIELYDSAYSEIELPVGSRLPPVGVV